MKRNEKGFGAVEVLLLVVTIGLLGVVGWMFFSKQQESKGNDNKTVDSTQQAAKEETKPTTENPPYTIDSAVADINKVLSTESCNGKGIGQVAKVDFTQVDNSAQFKYQGGKSIINNDLTYAFTQYGCGSQGSVGLLKRVDGGWKLISEDARIHPLCEKVRGQGFPSAIIDKCYVDNKATDPVNI